MYLFPYKRETLVLPLDAREALALIDHATEPVSRVPSKGNSKFLFNGVILEDTFNISKKVNYPQNYLPIIEGRIEATGRGCIIFLKYELFFSSKMFLGLWSVLSILIGLFFFIYVEKQTYALASVGAGALNYIVSLLNFQKQVKESNKALCEALHLI